MEEPEDEPEDEEPEEDDKDDEDEVPVGRGARSRAAAKPKGRNHGTTSLVNGNHIPMRSQAAKNGFKNGQKGGNEVKAIN